MKAGSAATRSDRIPEYGLNIPEYRLNSPVATLRCAPGFHSLIEVDQTPLGKNSRSNPATYSGLFDELRKLFASTKDAKRRGYKASRFSFNAGGGRCETCQGQGTQKIETDFLNDYYVVCPACNGKRFNRQTLMVKYKGKSIADVLDMPIEEAATFFENIPPVARILQAFLRIGLGYLTLGQPSSMLSGGEAQRVKLATELAKPETGKTLYILDEPTTGLHRSDVLRLLDVLSELTTKGNTVIVIEHNLDVMVHSDWIIDLGPEGGERGG
jgi:excinuclease ABC subunit A